MDNKITLKCNKCGTIFIITVIKTDIDIVNNYYCCCVACGNTGYKALEEINE